MEIIPSARDFAIGRIYIEDENDHQDVANALIEFAKLHVEAALKQASKKATAFQACNDDDPIIISESSIINAYPLENIK